MEALEEFVEEEKTTADQIFKEVSEDTRDLLRGSSPEGPEGYASGWEVMSEKTGVTGDSVRYIVYNPRKPQLTHLLERGHQSFNQFGGPYRRVKAIKHIGPAEKEGIRELLERLGRKL